MVVKPKPPTISEVATCLRDHNNPFFAKSTMKFFGDKLSNYGTRMEGDLIVVYRKRSGTLKRDYGYLKTTQLPKSWVFNPMTATMSPYA